MRYLSLFSGIEAATSAWHPLGWQCVGVSDIDTFACEVLKHRYPHVPNLGDVTTVTEVQIAALGQIDLVVFGSPCQDLSVAGKRKGLDGERSGLFFTAIRIVEYARRWCGCRFALWENVPGAFSSNEGRDFAAVVEHLAGIDSLTVPPKGWGNEGAAVGTEALVEWSTLDAQWFGVAQRRRRVFALADFGDWANRPPVLLEPESLRGDSAPRREAGQSVAAFAGGGAESSGQFEVAQCLTTGTGQRYDPETETILPVAFMPARSFGLDGGIDERFAERPICDALHTRSGGGNKAPLIAMSTAGHLPIAFQSVDHGADASLDLSPTMRAHDPMAVAHPVMSFEAGQSEAVAIALRGRKDGATAELGDDVAFALRASSGGGDKPHVMAYSTKLHNTSSNQAGKVYEEYTTRLDANSPPPALLTGWAVRRLTPVECERLQGFPDHHTSIPWRRKPAADCPDGPRYKALGNSMAVPVMHWIGQRIDFAVRWF